MGTIKLPIDFSPHHYTLQLWKVFGGGVFQFVSFVGFCCCYLVYCGLVFVGFFLTHPPQKKLDPRQHHGASAVWKTYTLSCGGNSSYMGIEQFFKHNINNRAFSHLTLSCTPRSASVLQLHRAWCSLLIMTSENSNAQEDLVCFAQVSLNSLIQFMGCTDESKHTYQRRIFPSAWPVAMQSSVGWHTTQVKLWFPPLVFIIFTENLQELRM